MPSLFCTTFAAPITDIIHLDPIESAGVRVPCSVIDTTPKTLVLLIALVPGTPGSHLRHHLNANGVFKHLLGHEIEAVAVSDHAFQESETAQHSPP